MSVEKQPYYRRNDPLAEENEEKVELVFHGQNPATQDELKKSLYVRSAYRHQPSFQNTTIQQEPDVLDRHAVQRMIDTDQTVENNFRRIIWRVTGPHNQANRPIKYSRYHYPTAEESVE